MAEERAICAETSGCMIHNDSFQQPVEILLQFIVRSKKSNLHAFIHVIVIFHYFSDLEEDLAWKVRADVFPHAGYVCTASTRAWSGKRGNHISHVSANRHSQISRHQMRVLQDEGCFLGGLQ